MHYYELDQDKVIRKFIKDYPHPSKDDLFNLFYNHFLHPDIETEFTHKVAKNAIELAYSYYLTLSNNKRFHFLRALGKLFDSALSIKIWEFQLSRDDASRWWKGAESTFILGSTHLVESLEVVRREMGIVQRKNLFEKIVCVEGQSEFSFINTFYLATRYANFDFSVHNYQGKGEIQNLVHFIKEKNRQGIKVLLSYDKDRQSNSFINGVKKKCTIAKDFGFAKDFEGSFPPKILKYALDEYIKKYTKQKLTIALQDIADLQSGTAPFLVLFKKKFNISINKVKLGKILGDVMAGIVYNHWSEIFNDKKKQTKFNYEIFKFLKFLMS